MPLRVDLTTVDGASELLAKLDANLEQRRPLHRVLGKRGEYEARIWFDLRESEPNKSGWPKAHYWSRIRKATSFVRANLSSAVVTIGDPSFNQKVYGGTLTAKEGKYLTLPAIAEAYGHSAREFNLHALIRWRDGKRRAIALVENYSSTLGKDGKQSGSVGGRVWYWLVRSVTQEADPRALPEAGKFQAALMEELRDFFARLPKASAGSSQ